MFEHSMRVPLIVTGPDIPKNRSISHEVYLQDVMATSLALGKITPPESHEFKSFLKLVQGKEEKPLYPEGIYGAYINRQRMIRKGNLKLMVYPKIKKVLLFDIEKDPLEMQDLSDRLEYRDTLLNLFDDLKQLQIKMGDTLDLSTSIPL